MKSIHLTTFAMVAVSATLFAGCEEEISGRYAPNPARSGVVLVDGDGTQRTLVEGRMSFSANDSGEIEIQNGDNTINLEVPESLLPRNGDFEFRFPHDRIRRGQMVDIVGSVTSESREREDYERDENCQVQVCRPGRRGQRECHWVNGVERVRIVRTILHQEIQIDFNEPVSSESMGAFQARRSEVIDSDRYRVSQCRPYGRW